MKKRSKNYRNIYEKHYGIKIPEGYHIHHKDGDRTNDDPTNLICVSPEEHVKLHEQLGHKILMGKFIVTASNRKGIPRTDEDKQKIRAAKKGIVTTPQTEEIKLKKAIKMGAKPFLVFKDNKFIGQFINLSGFCIQFDLNRRNVAKALRNHQNYKIKGYSFKYAEV